MGKNILIGLGLVVLAVMVVALYLKQKPPIISPTTQTSKKAEIVKEEKLPLLSLEQIFSNDHTFTATLSAQKKITIIATGDVIPARAVNLKSTQLKDFKWPYYKVVDFLKDADLTYINLETTFVDNCPLTDTGFVFCGDKRAIEGIQFAEIDLANMANNHTANQGPGALLETINMLKESGVEVVGISGPVYIRPSDSLNSNKTPVPPTGGVYKEIKGVKFAFLGFNDITKVQKGVQNVEEELIKTQIQEAKKNSDVVIVQYHWGVEYRELPDDRQIYLGRFTIDSGADLVIGNHPHWIQPVEYYQGKLITYAHGNFIFDQMWSEETQEGVAGKYTFYGKDLVDVEYFPVRIAPYGQPYFMEGAKRQKILDQMLENSRKLVND